MIKLFKYLYYKFHYWFYITDYILVNDINDEYIKKILNNINIPVLSLLNLEERNIKINKAQSNRVIIHEQSKSDSDIGFWFTYLENKEVKFKTREIELCNIKTGVILTKESIINIPNLEKYLINNFKERINNFIPNNWNNLFYKPDCCEIYFSNIIIKRTNRFKKLFFKNPYKKNSDEIMIYCYFMLGGY